jgi:hypothetical protein
LKILAAVVFGIGIAAALPMSGTSPVGSTMATLARVNQGARPSPTTSPTATPSPSPTAQQAAVATNCTIIVPANPLSARGLATPWQLTQAAGDPTCHEADPGVSAFVQAAVLDPATGKVSVYDPLVVDKGSRPAIAPVVPTLPAGAVVGIWTGYNGGVLTLAGAGAGSCVQGVNGSSFNQVAFCNATAWFQEAHTLMTAGKLTPPALGTAKDGLPCPTARDFSIVDQDQSDNTTDTYLVDAQGGLAQDTPANRRQMGTNVVFNGSDERLIAIAVDHALGCTAWMAPDLADASGTQMLTALPLNELQASAQQKPPVALVPALDPMVLVNNHTNLRKLNAYRMGVGQPTVASLRQASTKTYCSNLLNTGLPRIAADKQFTNAAASPFPAQASTLFNFLAMRFQNTFSATPGFLKCTRLLHVHNPVTLQMDGDVVVGATINVKPTPLTNMPAQTDDPATVAANPAAVPDCDEAATEAQDVDKDDAAVARGTSSTRSGSAIR